jgi:hypothetical protein
MVKAAESPRRPGLGRKVVRRVVSMVTAWVVLGAVLGVIMGMQRGGGAIGMLSHVVAGTMVFSVLGMILAPFSGRAKETLVGGMCGCLVGLASGPIRGTLSAAEAVNFSLVIGGLVGSTCWPWVRVVTMTGSGLAAALAFLATRARRAAPHPHVPLREPRQALRA